MKRIGLLTSGGDCQALNAAMRGVVKCLVNSGEEVEIYGFLDGYRGLIYGNFRMLEGKDFSGILTKGGTILGSSRTPFKTIKDPDENGLNKVEAMKQTVSMLIIDKKRLPLKESGLPQMVIDQAPKLMRRSKLPIVKAKVGPKISVLIADEKVFDQIPVKKEVKAEVSGLYIVGVKGIRGSLETPAPKKKGFFKRLLNK